MSNSYFAPVLDRDTLIKRINLERADGHKIILTNGCFDIFHAGHIRYLSAAKDLGGFLVVGLNSDRQVRFLKGNDRPYISEGERAEIISSFRFVDAVTIFDEPTVEDLIAAIRPDFHAKGTDYSEETVPEREVVKRFGGRVAIVGDPKDHSSSAMIEKLRSR